MDTAKQIADNDMTIFVMPGGYFWIPFLAQSSVPEYNKLAENMYIPEDWDEFDYLQEQYVMGKGTHAYMHGGLVEEDLRWGRWYRSKDILKGDNPYAGYLSNKKWYLNEVIRLRHHFHTDLII